MSESGAPEDSAADAGPPSARPDGDDASSATSPPAQGLVSLVGAGPGDPGLLTLAGRDAIRRADVIFYDQLANPVLLKFAAAGARRVLVGKRAGRTTVAQSEIERLLVEEARAGNAVVRLKGGDPFVFGRGGEEAQACQRAGVRFEVIPGVTSALAAPAYAGLPVTHRDHASSVTLITGTPGDARPEFQHNYEALVRTGGTLVFLMAMTRMGDIAANLIAAGMDPDTPAAAVRWGTLPQQRSVRAPLSTIAETATRVLHRPPVVFVVGEVAGLGEDLAWYEKRPLFGRRIVVTRARSQAGALASALEALGAEAVEFPTIALEPLAVPVEKFSVLADADWLVLTSVNGVERFFAALREAALDIRILAGVSIAAVGPSTRRRVEDYGLTVDAQPENYHAEGLLDALGDVTDRKLVLARAEVAREVLPRTLRERGAAVEILPVYRTVMPKRPMPGKTSVDVNAEATEDSMEVPSFESLGPVDMVTFTSSSTVTNFHRMVDGGVRRALKSTAVASIGPVTSAALRSRSVRVDAEPGHSTIEGLVDAVVAYFAGQGAAR